MCTSTHRHCKAFRYRARRAQNAASKRAAMIADKKGGNGRKAGSQKPVGTHSKASSSSNTRQKIVDFEVEEVVPNEAMLALLELARERLLQDDDVSQSADGTTSEWEECGSSTEDLPPAGTREGSVNSPASREEVSDSETISSKLSTPRLESVGRDGDATLEVQRGLMGKHSFANLSPSCASHRKPGVRDSSSAHSQSQGAFRYSKESEQLNNAAASHPGPLDAHPAAATAAPSGCGGDGEGDYKDAASHRVDYRGKAVTRCAWSQRDDDAKLDFFP